MTTIEERFSAALHGAARAWRLALDRRLKDLGVGQAGWMAIATIAKAGEPLSQTELAYRLGVEDPSVVTLVDRLMKAELVERIPSESDRRVKLVVLTDAGAALYKRVRKEADRFRAAMLSDADRALLTRATELLETLQQRAEELP